MLVSSLLIMSGKEKMGERLEVEGKQGSNKSWRST